MDIRKMLCLAPFALLAGCDDDDYIEDPPVPGVARDDVVVLAEDEESFWLADLTENDDPQVGTIREITEPVNGVLYGSGGPQYYRPDPGWFGVETLTYEADDGGGRGGRTSAMVRFDVESDGIGFERSQLVDDHTADAMAIGDVDGDGKKDVVTSDKDGSSIALLLNRTTAPLTFDFDVSLFEGGRYPRAVV